MFDFFIMEQLLRQQRYNKKRKNRKNNRFNFLAHPTFRTFLELKVKTKGIRRQQ